MPSPPAGFMSRATNLVFSQPAIEYLDPQINSSNARVREQFEPVGNLTGIPVRFYIYKKSTGDRIIILDEEGKIWDSTANEILYDNPNVVDFYAITLNDHLYFTIHNLVTGVNGEFLYVYDPDFPSSAIPPSTTPVRTRKAAGAPATGTFTVAVSTVAGNIEPGLHVMAVSFVTDTGFITKPALHTSFTAPDPKMMVNATAVPVGLGHITKRIIWMSMAIANFDGNLTAPELFKLYEIENNTSTAVLDTMSKFDTELQFSADPYIDLLSEIPAGTYLSLAGGRLVNCGAFADPHVLRISNVNEPEAIDSIDGVKEIMKGEGGGIKTTRPYGGNIVFWKSFTTGILRPNDDVPVNWPFDVLDSALGSEPYGVSEALEYPGLVYGIYLVANQSGLFIFDGSYPNPLKPLSYNIAPSWKAAGSIAAIKAIKIVVDPLAYRIYALVPGSGGINWFMGDFKDGLSADSIKWSPWNFDYLGQIRMDYIDAHVIIDPAVSDVGTTLLAIAKDSDALRKLVTDTFSSGIDIEGDIAAFFGFKIVDRELRDLHISSVKMLASSSFGNSSGAYDIKVTGVEPIPFTVDINDGIIEKFPNATDRIIEAVISAISGDLNISTLMLFVKPVYQERPDE